MRHAAAILWAAWACAGCGGGPQADLRGQTVKVAVIGGMTDTGFWQSLAGRFEKQTGCRVEVAATGPKGVIADAFRDGEADLITMHSSDTIVHLVADGYAEDPQPWLKNELVIVGPAEDPAKIRGMTDAGAALRKIHDSGAVFVVHSSLGAQEVLRDVLFSAAVPLEEGKMVLTWTDRSREILKVAAEKKAYTLVGRIPFLDGKMVNPGLVLMVRGDERLRRPYLLATARADRFPKANVAAAARLARFLRDEETQRWIADYGRGQLDDRPLFFRVASPSR